MKYSIARGRISHPILVEIKDFIQSLFYPVKNEKLILRFENLIGEQFNTATPVFYPFARTGFFAILESLNLPKGSKILLPTITIKQLLDVVLHFELKPILVDVDLRTGCWDTESLRIALLSQPK